MRSVSLFMFLFILASPAKGEETSIKIGATLALSGKYSFIGESERDGLLLGVEEVNITGGIKGHTFELVVEDNAGDAKAAVNSVQKLLNVDKVDFIFSAFTHITRAIAPIVSNSKKVMMYQSSVADVAKSNPLFFRDYMDIERDGETNAEVLALNGIRNVAYLRDDGEVCQFHEEAFLLKAKAFKINVSRKEEFPSGSNDIKPLLLRIANAKPEALAVCAWRDAHLLMKQLHELGMIKLRTFQALAPFLPVADTEESRKLYEKNQTVSTWYGFVQGQKRSNYHDFRTKFLKRFGYEPRPDAAYSYDDVFVLTKALKDCGSHPNISQECVAKSLAATNYDGAAGQLAFNSNRLSQRPVFLMEVRNGNWVDYERR